MTTPRWPRCTAPCLCSSFSYCTGAGSLRILVHRCRYQSSLLLQALTAEEVQKEEALAELQRLEAQLADAQRAASQGATVLEKVCQFYSFALLVFSATLSRSQSTVFDFARWARTT